MKFRMKKEIQIDVSGLKFKHIWHDQWIVYNPINKIKENIHVSLVPEYIIEAYAEFYEKAKIEHKYYLSQNF